MLLVVQVFQPAEQQHFRVFGAGGAAGAVLQVVHEAAELVQPADGARADGGAQALREQRLEQAALPARRELAQLRQRLRADAAFGRGDGAQKRRVVVAVDQQAQPGAQVFDFGAVEEALTARHLVRNGRLAQRLLEHAGLVVGAVQHGEVFQFDLHTAAAGHVARTPATGAQRLDARDGALGFVLFAVALDHAHRLAVAERAPELFLEQLRVVGDHVVRRAQDVAGGAVVLLQRNHLQARVVLRQPLQVEGGRAAPAVDALVVVTHGGEHRALAGQRFQQLVLDGVGVLVLVDQHVAQRVLPLRAHRVVAQQQFLRQRDQVVEIDRLVGGQPFFIAGHHARRHALVVVGCRSVGLRAVQALVLPAADGPLPAPRQRVVGRRAGVFQDRQHVVAVEDAELLFQAQGRAVGAENAHPQRVKGADHQVLRGARTDQLFRPFAHLLRGLVGEGDGRNLRRLVTRLQQPCDLVHDDAGFARAGTGQHQARPAEVVHCFELGGVQQWLVGHGGTDRSGPGRRAMIATAWVAEALATTGIASSSGEFLFRQISANFTAL